MSYSIGFYIKIIPEQADLISEIVVSFPHGEVVSNLFYVGVRLDADQYTPQKEILQGYSKKWKTDVVWLSFQSVVDAFEFHLWRDGELTRSLVYGCYSEERTWELTEGTPEPWESEILFSSDGLAKALVGMSKDDERIIHEVWRRQSICPGNSIPPLDSSMCAHKIGGWYQLPHYT